MAFSCTFPIAASAQRARDMRITPRNNKQEYNSNYIKFLKNLLMQTVDYSKKDSWLDFGAKPVSQSTDWRGSSPIPVTLKFGAILLSASVNQIRPRLMQRAADTSATL